MKTKISLPDTVTSLFIGILLTLAAAVPAQETKGTRVTKEVDPMEQSPDSSRTITENEAGRAITRAGVPRCVTIDDHGGNKIAVWNNCSYQVRVKVVIAFGPDFACRVINPGWGRTYEWRIGRLDEIRAC